MTTIDEQFEFRKLNTLCFFQNQIIHEKWNREKKNIKYTNSFKSAFDSLVNQNYIEAKQACKLLRKKSLKWLLYSEFKFYCNVFNQQFPSIEDIAFVFGFNPKHFEKFLKDIQKKLPQNRFAAQSYNDFINFKNQEKYYMTLPIKNIAVCATMSAGKSTFVNALLGRDVLPARNEATTAKITSVFDKDKSKYLLGFVEQNNNVVHRCLEANFSTINEWNNSFDINRIYLQGDLDGIGNKGVVVAVHDTPGTNNSNDDTHHRITIDFLSTRKMDAIVFVANAEQLCTTDENGLLKEIYEKVVSKQKIPVIFVLNKADCIDTEKENMDSAIKKYKEYVEEIGFTDAKIFPVSAKSARLLKMALKGKGDSFTESECDDFPSIVKKFTKRLFLDNSESNDCDNSEVIVNEERYESTQIQAALVHTGINKIEKEIEMIVK